MFEAVIPNIVEDALDGDVSVESSAKVVAQVSTDEQPVR